MSELTTEETLDVETLAHGRPGIARLAGRVFFVEGVAPGDRVRARLVREHSNYVEAELLEVLEPGPARAPTPCPLVDRCGGCPWQQVAYREQLAAKTAAVREALRRIAGIDDPQVEETIPSPQALGYRNRLKLRFENGRLGFYRARTNSLVHIDDCLLAEDVIRTSLAEVEAFVATLATRVTRVEIASRGQLPGVVVSINSAGRLRRADAHRVRDLLAGGRSSVTGVLMWGRGWRRQWGDTERVFPIDSAGTTLRASGSSFVQVNTEANRLLVGAVLEAAVKRRDERIFDLYAGAGNFSLPLARSCKQVVAVEADEASVEAMRTSAQRHGLRNLRLHASTVERFIETYQGNTPDVVVADPPRSGLRNTAIEAASLGAARFVYVSCNPATLARDVKEMMKKGYKIAMVQPVDLFPQTFHVETMCALQLT